MRCSFSPEKNQRQIWNEAAFLNWEFQLVAKVVLFLFVRLFVCLFKMKVLGIQPRSSYMLNKHALYH